jgi:ParB/RepB/Spo0J family partition protein
MAHETMIVQSVPMALIDRPSEADRLSIDPEAVQELASSIAEIGLLSPILIRPSNGRFEIIAGDRRFQACMSLGWAEIPVFIKDTTGQDIYVMRATENLQRNDLTIIEEARIYKNLHDNHNMSWEDIAKRTGKSAGNVRRRYDLLRMPDCLIKAMHERKIGYAVAEELCRLKELSRIEYFLGFCLDHGATKDVVASWVKEELSLMRQHDGTGGGGGGVSLVPEIKPIYIACDICHGSVDLNQVKQLRVCPDCAETIRRNM